jgi:2-amino-4-hydroxy-6-hydroxymethyldihydropteridine diphosphokinase
MNTAYLLLGGNMGDREIVIAKASELIHSACGKIIKHSSLYESAPWGFNDSNLFINQVIQIETAMTADELLENLLNIELLLGRTRNNSASYTSRLIDIDILFYNDEIINEDKLRIPHPLLQERRFTLEPLKEIAAELIHPAFNKTISDLLNECNDNSEITKYTFNI